MQIESAEMTKHALNSWLATSIAFINEIATLCECVGADAAEVARGLKSDGRVGQRAYLRPGAAFAGGTLARDLTYLEELARERGAPLEIAPAVRRGNDAHRAWPQRRLAELVPEMRDRTIALLGLTYKPGTSTLRRSGAIEVARWARQRGARLTAWDPAVTTLPDDLAYIELRPSPAAALRGAAAAVVGTEWPELASLRVEDMLCQMEQPVLLDPGRFLEERMGADDRIRYLAIGRAA
jgi:UDPglucose 6-dehydrogenase